ncbi:MAG: threonine--tRNA ligase [Candidatus Sungbacteria bacterium]|nr:threonine--tRNA ligase [Candidatus Sungbacteria bacterium]
MKNNQADPSISHIRHSLAHLLAAAVLELWPETKHTIGPAIDDGFYFDFEFQHPLSESDLPKIEQKMREILPSWKKFERVEMSAEEAKEVYRDNPYKQELIEELAGKGDVISFYKSGHYQDLCRGGHVENISEINPDAFKLTRIAGAYWRGDEKNNMLTRIYGLAFLTKEELENHIALLEEAKKRDHRVLGKELGLFAFSEAVGKGLPLWTEKGAAIRRVLERFIVDEEIRRGYKHVCTPDIANLDLYKKSGHYPYYKDSMYAPIVVDDEEYMLRPMTCPHHFELFLSQPRSYRDLPMRIAEVAKLYRYEKSGELTGLIRLRAFSLADAHIICADKDQAKQEVSGALDLIEYMAGMFGLKMGDNYWYRLSLGDRENGEKYFKNDAAWDEAEVMLREVLAERKCHFVEAPGEAAFYGPKIDVQMRNFSGKEDTAFTVQYDFVMPSRFNLTYAASDGTDKLAVVVHRSSIGAIERIIAFLIEHYAGAFPFWLAPVQVAILPVSEKFQKYAETILQNVRGHDIRAELDASNETLGKKIRAAELQKIPYLLVIGEREQSSQTVAVRERGKGDTGAVKLEELVSLFSSQR